MKGLAANIIWMNVDLRKRGVPLQIIVLLDTPILDTRPFDKKTQRIERNVNAFIVRNIRKSVDIHAYFI